MLVVVSHRFPFAGLQSRFDLKEGCIVLGAHFDFYNKHPNKSAQSRVFTKQNTGL
jgi:hypothetical protein